MELICDLVNICCLELMKFNVILINISCGLLVNEYDLVEVLNNYKIYVVGLDVFFIELFCVDNFLLIVRNCFIILYIVWVILVVCECLMVILVDNLKVYIGGKFVNNVVK